MSGLGAEPVRIGLIGAGPWAATALAPAIASGPHTSLAGVWARRRDAAEALAAAHGCPVFCGIGDLIGASEALAFAVPPAVQAELALVAIRARLPVLLGKPLAADLAGARRLADAAADAGIRSMLALSWRYATATREFLRKASAFRALGARGTFVSGAVLAGPFRTPWRLQRGPILDLGPHVLDLLDAAIGPVREIVCRGDRRGFVGMLAEHATGVISSVTLCASSAVAGHRAGVEIYGPEGVLELDCAQLAASDWRAVMCREFAELTRGIVASHPLDARRGLLLQELLVTAESQLEPR